MTAVPSRTGHGAKDLLASDVHGIVVVAAPPPHVTTDVTPTSRASRFGAVSARPVRPSRWLRPGWQIGAIIAGWPLWWALGISQFVTPMFAVPLAWQLWRRRRIEVTPGFLLWALFLICVAASVTMLGLTPDNTLPASGSGRYVAFTLRLFNYLAVTVMMLWFVNATEEECSRERLLGWFSALALATISLGTLALAAPDFGFNPLLSPLLPGGLDTGLEAKLAQVQPVLGETTPRPAAPFSYTNAWGCTLSLLMPWLVVRYGAAPNPRRRAALVVMLAFALAPIIYSLNRGVWIGLIIALVAVALRMAVIGRIRILVTLVSVLVVGATVFALSPLNDVVESRLEHGHSNDVRASLANSSIDAALQSPVLGYGSTRQQLGSDASIAIGRTPDCPTCGNFDIGSTGQLWLLLISQGLLGAGLYLAFFLRVLWVYRRDHSPIGIAASLVVLLMVFYTLFYSALTVPLAVALLSVGLLYRNQKLRATAVAERAGDVRPSEPVPGRRRR